MNTNCDLVLINPGDRKQIYQDLSQDYSAIEPPYWIAAIAAHLRRQGIRLAVIDANADNITPEETAQKAAVCNPLLAAVIVYGSQPSASTQTMTVAGKICSALREKLTAKIAIGGLHPSALPHKTLQEETVDFIVQGEGPYTLLELIKALQRGDDDYKEVPGLWYYNEGSIKNNAPAPLITNLDEVLPAGAWDLLPMEKYRAHNWHCFDDIEHRMPYGAIYTSFGCPFSCVFCCINAPFGKPGIRYRDPAIVADEIGVLVECYGVKNLKIIDELFVLKEAHYMTIVNLLIERGYPLNIWAYARVDTVKPENLMRMKKAGINWLALGIESANPEVRDGAQKRMKVNDIKRIVQTIQDAGIRVIGNFIFGLPDDTMQTMKETLEMAIDLNCEFINIYCAMAYPGSKLYEIAVSEHWQLPQNWIGFSQHSYDMQPLPTKFLTAADVLRFRDNAFHTYFERPEYLQLVEDRFGMQVRRHIQEMTKTRIKRKLLGN